MDTSQKTQCAFEQKPHYDASPAGWIQGGGHAHLLAMRQFFDELAAYRAKLVSLSGGSIRNTWMLPFRTDFRLINQDADPITMKLLVLFVRPSLRHVLIWLLSQSADRFRLYGIQDFCNDESPQVRLHVAKALRRLEAWWILDDMARACPDDTRIQWLASAPTTRRSFGERLNRFARNVDDSQAGEVSTPSRMPFWAIERSWGYTAPKSAAIIRRMLRRIRHWVRWGVS
jgi:hypothetical protein